MYLYLYAEVDSFLQSFYDLEDQIIRLERELENKVEMLQKELEKTILKNDNVENKPKY